MPIVVNKPNLYVVLTRRGRTVESFLQEMGVNDREALEKTLTILESHYNVTEDFIKQAFSLFRKTKQKNLKQKVIEKNSSEDADAPMTHSQDEEIPRVAKDDTPRPAAKKVKSTARPRRKKKMAPKSDTGK